MLCQETLDNFESFCSVTNITILKVFVSLLYCNIVGCNIQRGQTHCEMSHVQCAVSSFIRKNYILMIKVYENQSVLCGEYSMAYLKKRKHFQNNNITELKYYF